MYWSVRVMATLLPILHPLHQHFKYITLTSAIVCHIHVFLNIRINNKCSKYSTCAVLTKLPLHYKLYFDYSKFNHLVVARQRLNNLCPISMT